MANREVGILFGRGQIPVRVPAGARPSVIRKPALPKLARPSEAVLSAFRNPIAAPPLGELAKGRASACILICDITRPVPNRLFLRPMIEEMMVAGIPREAHRRPRRHRPPPAERGRGARRVGRRSLGARQRPGRSIISPATRRPMSISASRRRAARRSSSIAASSRPICRIATGLVEPHFMAGWSGGRKVVAPGVAHHETIRTFHSARFMEDPLAIQCNLVGNPLHEEQLEIVRMVGDIYALNTVIDEERDLVYVNFGEVIESHLAAVDFVTARHPRSRAAAVQDGGHLGGRLSARQDLLPDGQGHGDAARHPRARRHADHRLGMLGRLRLGRVPGGAGSGWSPSGRSASSRR